MKLKQVEEVHELLKHRALLLDCIEEMNLATFSCISIEAHSSIRKIPALIKEVQGMNQLLAVWIYEELITELEETMEKFEELGIEIPKKKFMSGDKRFTEQALKVDLNQVTIGKGRINVGQIMPSEKYEFAQHTDLYKE